MNRRLVCGLAVVLLAANLLAAVPGCDARCGGSGPSEPGPDSSSSAETEPETTAEGPTFDGELGRAVAEFHAELAHTTYADALERARRLALVSDHLAERPTRDRLDAARQAWLAVREPYLQTLAFSKTGDGRTDGTELLRSARKLESKQTSEREASADTAGGERIAEPAGPPALRAAEFLLWGLEDVGASVRSRRGFERGGGVSNTEARRRRELLRQVTEDLVAELEAAADRWGDGSDHRRAFLDRGARAGVAAMFSRLDRAASRIADGWLRPRLEGRGVRSARSVEADSVDESLAPAAIGLRNIYRGEYERTDNSRLEGPGLAELVEATDPQSHEELASELDAAVEALGDLGGSPGGGEGEHVRDAIARLEGVRETFAAAERRLGVPVRR